MPTKNSEKVFCVGLSRTGTTSLTAALRGLGLTSVHYLNPNKYAKIHEWDSASDLPIPSRYKSLDKRFPNSKFIYLDRDTDSWLVSCEKLWASKSMEKLRKHKWPLEYRVETYGIEYFDKDQFKSVFLKHREDVLDYFKDRPNDLLTMNIVNGDGWKKLVDFLDPILKFPLRNTWNWRSKRIKKS